MSWWEWLIVLGLWAWNRADILLLRRGICEAMRLVDERRIESTQELRYDLEQLERKRRQL